jgi:hypothetical protein
MTFTDRNDLLPAQVLLEWVTPKILLMGTEKTERKPLETTFEGVTPGGLEFGPS